MSRINTNTHIFKSELTIGSTVECLPRLSLRQLTTGSVYLLVGAFVDNLRLRRFYMVCIGVTGV